MSNLKSTPKQDGYYMPAEWQKHSKCWMIWPTRTDNWRNKAKPAQEVFTSVALTISKYEDVVMATNSSEYETVKNIFKNSNVEVVEIANDDAWMRDVGPTFVINDEGNIRGVDWRFNAWGGEVSGLYASWDNDDLVAKKVCEHINVDYYSLKDFIFEGGAIHVDGEGTAIVVSACLLDESRNPHLNKAEIENILKEYLNLEKIIWLPNGIYLDETNEHVDNIIQYCSVAEVVLAWCDDKSDPQYEMSKKALDVLENSTDARGRKFKVHKIHIPNNIIINEEECLGVEAVDGSYPRNAGDRMAASYTNFYFANDAVIVPIFNDEVYDKLAIDKLKQIFKTRKIETIYSREILLGGGNIHCITQQQPIGDNHGK